MGRYVFNEEHVASAITCLKDAEQSLNGVEADISSALSNIVTAAKGNIDIPTKEINAITGDVLDILEPLTAEVTSAYEDLKEYFSHGPVARFFMGAIGTLNMIGSNLIEGVATSVEGLVDGVLTIGGWGAGLFSKDAQDTVAGWIEKDVVGDWFDEQYENGILASTELYSAYSQDSGVATVLKGFGTAAGYIGLGWATGGAAWADVGAAALGGLGTGTQRGLQEGQDFGEASITGLKEAGLNAAAAAGGRWLGGKLAGKMADDSVNILAKDVDNLTDKAKLVSKLDDSVDDVTKAATKADDVAGATTKLDDATSAATKADDAVTTVKNADGTKIEIDNAGNKTLISKDGTSKTVIDSEGNLKMKSSEVESAGVTTDGKGNTTVRNSDGSVTKTYSDGKIENISNDGRTIKTTEPDGTTWSKSDASNAGTHTDGKGNTTIIDKDGTTTYRLADKSEITVNNKGDVISTKGAETSTTPTKVSGDGSGVTTKVKETAPVTSKADDAVSTTSKVDNTISATSKTDTPKIQARTTSDSGSITSKARMDVSDEGIAARNATNKGTSGSSYDLSEIAKDGPIMKDHEGASSIGKALEDGKSGYDLGEIAKDGPIMKDHEGASSIGKALDDGASAASKVDDITSKARMDVSDEGIAARTKAADEGRIFSDESRASTFKGTESTASKVDDVVSATSKADDITSKARMDVSDEGIAARNATNKGTSGSSYDLGEIAKDGPIMKDHEGASSIGKALDDGKSGYDLGEIAKDGPIMKDHEGASSIGKALDDGKSGYDLGEIAKDGPIMKDHEGASSIGKTLDDAASATGKTDSILSKAKTNISNAFGTATNKVSSVASNIKANVSDAITSAASNPVAVGEKIGEAGGISAASTIANETNFIASNSEPTINIPSKVDIPGVQDISDLEPIPEPTTTSNNQVPDIPGDDDPSSFYPGSGDGDYSKSTGGNSIPNIGDTDTRPRIETNEISAPDTSESIPEPTPTPPEETPTSPDSTLPDNTQPNDSGNSSNNNNTGMSGDITITEEPVPETPITNPGNGSAVDNVMDNVSNIFGGNQNGNSTSNYSGSLNNFLNNSGNQLGPDGELSYENSPNGELLEDNNLLGETTKGDKNNLDVISIDQDSNPGNASTESGGSVIPTVLGVGAAAAAGVAGIHYIKNKKDEKNADDDYYYDESNDNEEENNNVSDDINENIQNNVIIEDSNDVPEFETPKYKAGTVNQLKMDDGDNIIIEDNYDVIKPQNEELE